MRRSFVDDRPKQKDAGRMLDPPPCIFEDEGPEFIREVTLLTRAPGADVNEPRLSKVKAFDRE